MKKVKIIIFIVIIALILGIIWVEIIGKKPMIDAFFEAIRDIYQYGKDNRSSSEMVVNYMEKKYGESFYYSKRGYKYSSDDYITHFVTCDSFPGKEIVVEIYGIGKKEKKYKDGYLVAKYEEDIKKMIQDISLKYFRSVLVLGVADTEKTSEELSSQATLEDVFANEEFCLNTIIVLKESEVTSKDTIDSMLYEIFKKPLYEKINEANIRVEVISDDVYAKLELDENADWDKATGPYCANVYKRTEGCYIDWIIIDEKKLESTIQRQKIGEKTINDYKISDRWEDGEFLYCDKKLKLMCNSIKDLGQLYIKISERTINSMIISNLDSELCVINNSGEIKNFLECEIYGIRHYIDEEEYNKNPFNYNQIKLSKGITWKSTMEDIINAYGEPKEKEIISNTYMVLSYKADNGCSLKLGVRQDFGLTRIEYFYK